MAQQVSGVGSVEIKAVIGGSEVQKGIKRLTLDKGKAISRIVYFFDTPRLELFGSGVIVRARRVPGHAHDCTVKIRPVRATDVPAKWRKMKGFKVEADASESGIVHSASLTRPVDKGLIKDVAAGKTPLSALFDKHQQLFLAEMCRIRYDLDKLKVLGPVPVLWWKIAHPGVPVPMTAELWTRGDKASTLEVSIRVSREQAAFANAGFFAFLSEHGAERDNAQQAKTRWVLEYFAKAAATAGATGTASKPRGKAKPAKKGSKKKDAAKSKRAKPSARPAPVAQRASKRPPRKAPQRQAANDVSPPDAKLAQGASPAPAPGMTKPGPVGAVS